MEEYEGHSEHEAVRIESHVTVTAQWAFLTLFRETVGSNPMFRSADCALASHNWFAMMGVGVSGKPSK